MTPDSTSDSTLDFDRNVLAAEYIIGTLDQGERAKAQELIGSDPAFAALVQYWESRLGALQGMVAPIEPPPAVWEKIVDALGGAAEQMPMRLPEVPPAAPSPPLANGKLIAAARRLTRWRAAAAGLAALAAGLAALVIIGKMTPGSLPEALRPAPRVVEVAKTIEPPRFVAVLQQQDAAAPAFILTVDPEARRLTVRRVAAAEEAGKSYELWLISEGSPARSLGVVDQEFSTTTALTAIDRNTVSSAIFAVTLEPEGGSPSGAPSGAPLWSGHLVEAVPPG
jgi:anti-sigma-K factor RskA